MEKSGAVEFPGLLSTPIAWCHEKSLLSNIKSRMDDTSFPAKVDEQIKSETKSKFLVYRKGKHHIGKESESKRDRESKKGAGTEDSERFCVDPVTKFSIHFVPKNQWFRQSNLKPGSVGKVLRFPWDVSHRLHDRITWLGIRCVRSWGSYKKVIAFVREEDTQMYYLILFLLHGHKEIAFTVDKHELFSGNTNHVGSVAQFIEDENGRFYCIIYWHETIEQSKKTIFSLSRVFIDDDIIRSHVIINNQEIDSLWQCPFIIHDIIGFLPQSIERNAVVTISLKDQQKRLNYVSKNFDDNYCHFEKVSQSAIHINNIIFYSFDEIQKVGRILALDWKTKRWNKYFEFKRHHALVASAEIFVLSDDHHLFLNGKCGVADCTEGEHYYNFSLEYCGRTFLPTIDQLIAYNSQKKVQIFHGHDCYESAKILFLKVKEMSAPGKIIIYVPKGFMEEYCKIYSDASEFYGLNFQEISSETAIDDCASDDGDFFIIGIKSIAFQLKNCLLRRRGRAIIVIDGEVCEGIDQPRTFAWYRLSTLKNRLYKESTSPSSSESMSEIKQNKLETFLNHCGAQLGNSYPKWMNHLSCTDDMPICIPPSLDVNKHQYCGPVNEHENSSDNNRNLIGSQGEQCVFQAFNKLEIGGILIAGFNIREFAMRSGLQKKIKNKNIHDFEVDFLYCHPHLGLVIIEVKSSTDADHLLSSYKRALIQLETINVELNKLFRLISYNQPLQIPIYNATWFPFAHFSESINDRSATLFLDKNITNQATKLREIFTSRMHPELLDASGLYQFHRFVCAIAGYRRPSFISASHNALVIHKLIEKQVFNRSAALKRSAQLESKQKSINSMDGVYFTNEQWNIIKNKEQHQIIFGPPGTGKTLIILTKALQAAQEIGNGENICIILPSIAQCIKYQTFFEKKSYLSSIKILRFPTITNKFDAELSDDVFIDELFFSENSASFLKKRLQADRSTGRTVVGLTGGNFPCEINAQKFLETIVGAEFRLHKLNAVVRRTNNIVQYWSRELRSSFGLQTGHSVNGQSVKRIKEKDSLVLLENLLRLVKTIVGSIVPETDDTAPIQPDHFITPSNVAIITENTVSCNIIKSYLASNNVRCGSIEDQMNDIQLVGVTEYLNAPSFEWPIVFVVSLMCVDYFESFRLIAASRCIAQLTVIELDYTAIQDDIQGKLQKFADISEVNLCTFKKTVQDTRNEPFYMDNVTLNLDYCLAILRNDYLPPEFKLIESWANCRSLTDLLRTDSTSNVLISMLHDDDKITNHANALIQHRFWLTQRIVISKLPLLLSCLWSNFQKEQTDYIWASWRSFLEELLNYSVHKLEGLSDVGDRKRRKITAASLQKTEDYAIFVDVVSHLLVVLKYAIIEDEKST